MIIKSAGEMRMNEENKDREKMFKRIISMLGYFI